MSVSVPPSSEVVAVIADSHLGGPGGAAEPLLEQLRALPGEGVRHLVLLGDICHLWIGNSRYETEESRQLVATLRELRRDGLRVDYIEGNRDFFLAHSPWADAFDSIGTELSFEAGGRRYLAVHGDGLDRRDWRYRMWRRLSKSTLSRFLSFRVPRRFARRLVDSTEQRLADTNLDRKRHIPEEALRAYGEGRLAESYDVLLLGHFHQPAHWQVAGGEILLLDAWFNSRRVERFGLADSSPVKSEGG